MLRLEGLESYFVFTGWLTNKEDIYSQIDLLLITSNYEGVPLNMLEAIVFYKPVMAPNFGVFKEYLSPVFLYDNFLDLCKKLERLSCDRELVKEFAFIRRKVIQLHSRVNFERKVFEIVEKFL